MLYSAAKSPSRWAYGGRYGVPDAYGSADTGSVANCTDESTHTEPLGELMAGKPAPLIVRFWAKVQITPSCWIWHGEQHKQGYGRLRRGKPTQKKEFAHRLAYELFVGPIPDGLTLDHLCRNTRCVNPDHLEAVPMRENTMRGIGPSAKNARKTHCYRGHAFTPENTRYIQRPDGVERRCRTCQRKPAPTDLPTPNPLVNP